MSNPDEEIDVWEVTPHLDPSFDVAIFDDHTKAIEYVKELAESIIDDLGHGDEAPIIIKHTTMSRYDFEECRCDY